MTFVFILLFFPYLLLLGLMIYGWNRGLNKGSPPKKGYRPAISVVIAARNESQTIERILKDISRQTYEDFNVILVNDGSTDRTSEIVMQHVAQDARFTLVRSGGEGKKAALTTGIQVSKGEIIVTTDADCSLDRHWLQMISGYFEDRETMLVFGGVKISSSTFFSSIQAHEFLSLIGTAAATQWWGFPTMCNGANLAFRKQVFYEVGGYSNNLHIPSGDDEFLMRKIFQLYPKGIKFVACKQAVVTTSAVNMRQFIHQRIRWAGKWTRNSSMWSVCLAGFIFLFQLSILAMPWVIFFDLLSVPLAITLLTLKVVMEGVFLKKIAAFLNVSWNWTVFFVLQIAYPFYVVLIAIISPCIPFEWKGRTLKSVTISMVKK